MAVIKQGGGNPYKAKGQVMTTMGYREARAPMCEQCGQRTDDILTKNGNGKWVCSACGSPKDLEVLKGTCDPDNCACGQPESE
jgi:hypothetical protein